MIQENRINNYTLVHEQELWDKYIASGKDVYFRNELVEMYMEIVKTVAAILYLGRSSKVDFEDLRQDGVFGLMDAVETFDPSLGVRFITHAVPRIRGSILQSLNNSKWALILARHRDRQVREAESKLNRGFSKEELLIELSKDKYEVSNLNKKQYEHVKGRKKAEMIVNGARNGKIQSISDMLDYEASQRQYNSVEDTTDYPMRVEKKELVELVDDLTARLGDEKRSMINLHYGYDMTWEKIGEIFDLTGSRIQQIGVKSLAWLRDKLESRGVLLEDVA